MTCIKSNKMCIRDSPLTEEEKLAQELEKANEQIEEQKDKYLRLSAEFDNYRKSTMKEKAELIQMCIRDSHIDVGLHIILINEASLDRRTGEIREEVDGFGQPGLQVNGITRQQYGVPAGQCTHYRSIAAYGVFQRKIGSPGFLPSVSYTHLVTYRCDA